VHIAVFSPVRAGLATLTLRPTNGRVELSLAADSITAVLSGRHPLSGPRS
jgi:hypothetical protein